MVKPCILCKVLFEIYLLCSLNIYLVAMSVLFEYQVACSLMRRQSVFFFEGGTMRHLFEAD